MTRTRHAIVRAQQRGISPLVIDLLQEFGAWTKAADGASIRYFDRRAKRKVASYLGPSFAAVRNDMNVYAVLAGDGRVITVAYRLRRIQRDVTPHQRRARWALSRSETH